MNLNYAPLEVFRGTANDSQKLQADWQVMWSIITEAKPLLVKLFSRDETSWSEAADFLDHFNKKDALKVLAEIKAIGGGE